MSTAHHLYQVFVRSLVDGRTLALDVLPEASVTTLKDLIEARDGIPSSEQVIAYKGRVLEKEERLFSSKRGLVTPGSSLDLSLRLQGGKGGFGSNLRAAGKRQLTDNFDACRDLQGRRIRHKTAQEKLSEWQAESQERELEKLALKHIGKVAREEQRTKGTEVNVQEVRQESKAAIEGVQSAISFALKKRGIGEGSRKDHGHSGKQQQIASTSGSEASSEEGKSGDTNDGHVKSMVNDTEKPATGSQNEEGEGDGHEGKKSVLDRFFAELSDDDNDEEGGEED